MASSSERIVAPVPPNVASVVALIISGGISSLDVVGESLLGKPLGSLNLVAPLEDCAIWFVKAPPVLYGK